MKKIITLLLILSLACTKSSSDCGSVNGHPLHKGSNGGCYYINDSGNKEYVDRSECNC